MLGKIAIFCKNIFDWSKTDRCFIKYFSDAFSLSNNLLLLTLILLSVFIIFLYTIISAQLAINSSISLMIIILLSSAFAAGFFYSIKYMTDNKYDNNSDEEKKDMSLNTFYTGIGEHYLSFIIMFVMFFVFAAAVVTGTFFLANKFICSVANLGLTDGTIYAILSGSAQSGEIIKSLSVEQQQNLKYWSRLFLFTTQAYTFLIMLWIPEMLYTKRNVFISFFTSIKKVFSDFPRALCVYLTITFLNYVLALLFVVFSKFYFISFLLNIAYLYLLIYTFYAIFIYYRKMFVDENRGWIA